MNIPANTQNITTEAALQVLAEANILKAQGHNVAMLCVGQPDFIPAPHIREAAAKATHDGPHGYTNPIGIAPLREALAQYHEIDANHPLNPNRFIITPGGKPTAWLALLMLANQNAEIIIPDPFFPVYETAIHFANAKPITIPLREKDNFNLNPHDLRERINKNTRLVLVNSPSNPTGSMISQNDTQQIAEIIAEFPNTYILSDEIYSRITFPPNQHHSFLKYDFLDKQLIYLNGFSKSYAMTGWRVGYGYWPQNLLEYASRFTTNAHSCVNGIAQIAAIAALQGPQDQVQQMTQAFHQRAKATRNALLNIPNVSCAEPQGAFYLFPRVKAHGLNSHQLARQLLQKEKLALSHGTAFGANGEGYMRFSIAADQSEILDGVQRLARFLNQHNQ
ncbi:MAG: aminotransferase class I/II-fold pyridoxal phosphate-dependent enzyme [Alphaproteobacteria bacterium]